ncbi:MAG: protein kinase [Dethiobacteria bacterium]|jgi:serine/threonine protein kinase|nr:protein kinase [Acholeplasmataceae bacterium]HHU98063.1 protein kinase [Petrimonas sp.]
MLFEIKDKGLFINDIEFRLPNLCFIKEIGEGANAIVFLAYNILLNRQEAVKIWKPKKYRKTVDRNRFCKEVVKNANVKSPNIASFYDANIENGFFYARIEYIPGISLKKYLQEAQELVFRFKIMETILETMMSVYEAGFKHGDLHSGNVIVDKHEPYIIDFGTSAFSGIVASQKRDCRMLLDLCFEVLPELHKLKFFDKTKVIEQGSEIAVDFLLYCLRIIWDFESASTTNLDGYGYRAWHSRFKLLSESYPFVDTVAVDKFFSENYSRNPSKF